jgi:tRNA A37 threonylcarbamoyladenosine dehydratase
MNQRIQELVGQAKFAAEETLNKQISKNAELDAFAEKFAELIVRECVGVADDYVKDCMCDEHKNCKHPRSIIGRKIREHFGVEQ